MPEHNILGIKAQLSPEYYKLKGIRGCILVIRVNIL
jgi:hypothetical protein